VIRADLARERPSPHEHASSRREPGRRTKSKVAPLAPLYFSRRVPRPIFFARSDRARA
jgi:hypothetical protein